MTKLITTNFQTHNAKQFVESLDETANSIYYVTVGKHTPFPSDNTPPEPGASGEDTHYQIYRDMIYGKQITTSDIKHMIDNNPWTTGTVYTQYEHTVDLRNKKFFAVVEETGGGGYSVFKCLFNNGGSPSTDKPTIDETSPDDDVYITTGDKYQWKFMFTIPSGTYTKFSTSEKVPYVSQSNVSGNAVAGSIDVVDVKAGGSRYFSVANGVVKVAAVNGNNRIIELESLTGANLAISVTESLGANSSFNSPEKVRLFEKYANGDVNTANNLANAIILEANTTFLRVSEIAGDFFNNTSNVYAVGTDSNNYATISSITASTSSLSANTDFYKGSTFYVAAGAGAGQSKTISEYIVTGSARRVLIPTTFTTAIDSTSIFEITPRVVISGDGQDAEGRAIINTSTFAVDTIEMTQRGYGYSFATAQVLGNTGITGQLSAENANVVPIISPKGGHGSDPINELYADTVGISVDFVNSENNQIPAVNDFRQVTILKDPLYANVVVTIANTLTTGGSAGQGTSFQDGEVITQTTSGAHGIVQGRSSGTVTVANVYGQFLTTTDANTTHRLVGASSNTSTSIASFKTNERSGSSFTTFDQRTRLSGFVNASSLDFQIDEKITQDTTDTTAFIHSINSSAQSITLTNKRGNFNESEAGSEVYFRGANSEAQGYHTSENGPDITPHTGEVIYVENITPITRDDAQTERVKLMIKF